MFKPEDKQGSNNNNSSSSSNRRQHHPHLLLLLIGLLYAVGRTPGLIPTVVVVVVALVILVVEGEVYFSYPLHFPCIINQHFILIKMNT